MPQKLGKHTPFFELLDAQAKAGCSICRLVYKSTDRYLDSLLYEAVLDPDVRAKLKTSRGFCAEHVEMLARQPGRALGVALIYRDIIRTIADAAEGAHFRPSTLERMRSLGRKPGTVITAEKLQADNPCPACVIAEGAERTYLEMLIAHLDDDKLYAAYSENDGLCLPHLIAALQHASSEESLRRLVEPQVARYRVMLRDLDEFIRKRDHRFRHEKMGEEGDVWLRAMNAAIGGAGRGTSADSGGRRTMDFVEDKR